MANCLGELVLAGISFVPALLCSLAHVSIILNDELFTPFGTVYESGDFYSGTYSATSAAFELKRPPELGSWGPERKC